MKFKIGDKVEIQRGFNTRCATFDMRAGLIGEITKIKTDTMPIIPYEVKIIGRDNITGWFAEKQLKLIRACGKPVADYSII